MTESFEKGIEVTRENNKVNIILDMSIWDLFELCKYRYHLRHGLNRTQPIHKKSKALDSGSIAHEGLEVYFKLLQEGKHYNDRMQATLTRMRVYSSDPDQSNSDPEDVALVIKAVEESCNYWRFEDEQLDIIEVERAFAYVLYEDDYVRIIISGKIDVLVNMSLAGSRTSYTRLPIDHKTFSRDFELSSLSNQFQNYCVATESNYLYVNRIGLHDNSVKNPKPAEEKFKRIPVSYNAEKLNGWKQNLINGILFEYLDCISRGEWRQNFTSCDKFNRRCEYYDVCDSAPADRERLIADNYVISSPWDVTARLKKD